MIFPLTFSILGFLTNLGIVSNQEPQLLSPILYQSPTLDIEYSADGNYLVSCSRSELKLWEAQTGAVILSIDNRVSRPYSEADDCPLGFQEVAVAPDGNFIISARSCAATESGTHNRPYDENAGPTLIEVWESATGKLIKQIQISPYRVFVQEITLSPDAKQVAITTATAVHAYGYVEGELAFSVWDIASGQMVLERPYESGKFSQPKGYVLATGSKAIHLINTLTRKEQASFFLDAELLEMGMSPSGKTVYAVTAGKLWVWEIDKATAPKIYKIPELAEYGTAPFFSTDGQHMILLNWNNSQLTKYRLSNGKQLSSQVIIMDQGAGAVPRLAINHPHQLMAYAHYPDVGAKALPIKAIRLFSEEEGFLYE